MTNETYERVQLELIVAQYELRGYKVAREVQSEKDTILFDAIASKESPPETIVVELVNRQRNGNETMGKRAEQISRQFAGKENVTLDIRYLDRPEERETQARERAASSIAENTSAHHLQQLVKRRLAPLRISARDRSSAARALLADWAILAQTVRAFCAVKNIGSELDSVEILYDALLQRFQLVGAEQLASDGPIKDLRELYELVEEALEGALIDLSCAQQLRFHLQSLRGQMRKFLA